MATHVLKEEEEEEEEEFITSGNWRGKHNSLLKEGEKEYAAFRESCRRCRRGHRRPGVARSWSSNLAERWVYPWKGQGEGRLTVVFDPPPRQHSWAENLENLACR
jgi:hypothetical protein